MIKNVIDYDGILFDFDGVIIDSEPVHFDCWRQILEPLGIPMDWETYRDRCIGISDYRMLEFLGGRADPPVPADRLWKEYGAKNALFVRRVLNQPPMPDGLPTFLEELDGYRKAVVSSSGSAEVKPILSAAGVDRFFDVIVCGDDVARHKPDPEPYLMAAERLGVRNPLVVEDSEAGAESGRKAGFDVILIDRADRMIELVRERIGTSVSR